MLRFVDELDDECVRVMFTDETGATVERAAVYDARGDAWVNAYAPLEYAATMDPRVAENTYTFRQYYHDFGCVPMDFFTRLSRRSRSGWQLCRVALLGASRASRVLLRDFVGPGVLSFGRGDVPEPVVQFSRRVLAFGRPVQCIVVPVEVDEVGKRWQRQHRAASAAVVALEFCPGSSPDRALLGVSLGQLAAHLDFFPRNAPITIVCCTLEDDAEQHADELRRFVATARQFGNKYGARTIVVNLTTGARVLFPLYWLVGRVLTGGSSYSDEEEDEEGEEEEEEERKRVEFSSEEEEEEDGEGDGDDGLMSPDSAAAADAQWLFMHTSGKGDDQALLKDVHRRVRLARKRAERRRSCRYRLSRCWKRPSARLLVMIVSILVCLLAWIV